MRIGRFVRPERRAELAREIRHALREAREVRETGAIATPAFSC